MDVIELTKKLIRFNTVNPPGNEEDIALYLGGLLKKNGFRVEYPVLDKHRLHLVAEKGVHAKHAPVILSGHLDVVPIGTKKWTKKPFSAEIESGKLFGRGSSDMKGGVAAIVCAAINVFKESAPKKGLRIILTAGEEVGCFGCRDLQATGFDIGKASGLIIAEPTANLPFTGHKGGLFINAYASGTAAHASMPQKGDNAIYKAAHAIVNLEKIDFNVEKDPLLGLPTINIGIIKGGTNFNSVPDSAEFTIDVRTTGKLSNEKALEIIQQTAGNEITLEPFVNLNACYTNEKEAFVNTVYEVCESENIKADLPASAPYLTDASVLQPWLDNVPTVILGPGEPGMAHKTDEYCYVDKIVQAGKIYQRIILNWDKTQ